MPGKIMTPSEYRRNTSIVLPGSAYNEINPFYQGDAKDEERAESEWGCLFCEGVNPRERRTCEHCGARRLSEERGRP